MRKFGLINRGPVTTIGIEGLGLFDASGYLDLRWWVESMRVIRYESGSVTVQARIGSVPTDIHHGVAADFTDDHLKLRSAVEFLSRIGDVELVREDEE